MMTRKHFQALAEILSRRGCHIAHDPLFAEGWHAATSAITHAIADYLASENPNFDRDRFLEACGLEQ